MTAAILCSDLSFSWPDAAPVLSGLTVSFGPGRTGLIGVNGSGKSTLLRLIAGELRPGSGVVRARGEVGYLPQAITLGTRRTVSDLLGITAARDALHAIEAGEAGEAAFAAVGDDWDVEERARAWLDRLGLGQFGLDDPGGQPRRAVPAFGRDHPLAPSRPRSRPDRDRPAITRGPTLRPLPYWPARAESARLRERTRPPGPMPLGYGVIGSPTGSGPVSLGSSPGTPAVQLTART